MRTCMDCPASLEDRHKLTKRCVDCANKRNTAKSRIAARRFHEKLRSRGDYRRYRAEKAWIERINHYGFTTEEYCELVSIQEGKCAGCGYIPKPGKRLNIDHKHQKNDKRVSAAERRPYVRGLLCHLCNRAVGLVRDNAETLARLANYLKYPPAVKLTLPSAEKVTEYLRQHQERNSTCQGTEPKP